MEVIKTIQLYGTWQRLVLKDRDGIFGTRLTENGETIGETWGFISAQEAIAYALGVSK